MTTVLIGTDEAGYGPNLGPLTICATRWHVEGDYKDLYEPLHPLVAKPTDREASGQVTLVIGDSKQIHRANDLSRLELPVLALLHSATGKIPQTFADLANSIGFLPDSSPMDRTGCFSAHDLRTPVACDRDEILQLSEQFSRCCDQAAISLNSIRCRVIYPAEFNSSLAKLGNKANLLSSSTLELVKRLMDSSLHLPEFKIFCDKHGGRDKYVALIQHWLTDQFVSVVHESEESSIYRYREPDRSVEISFRARGESSLPIAVSSMIAKYMRELAMIAWNRFWRQHLPHIAPTKGYPTDAKRFIADISEVRNSLKIPLDSVWRFR